MVVSRSPERRRHRTERGDKKSRRSSQPAKRPARQRRRVSKSIKPAHALNVTDRRRWPGVPSVAEYRTPSRRRGRPRGAIAAPSRVALLIWWARSFPIRPARIIHALGFDTGQSQGEKCVKRAVARVERDLRADGPQFFSPHLTRDRYISDRAASRGSTGLATHRVPDACRPPRQNPTDADRQPASSTA